MLATLLPRSRASAAALALLLSLALTPATRAAKGHAEEARGQQDPLSLTVNADAGYRLDLTDTDWRPWESVNETVAHADWGAKRWQGSMVTAQACFAEWHPGDEAVKYALLRTINQRYPSPHARNHTSTTIDGHSMEVWEKVLPREDQVPLRFRFHLIKREHCSLLVAVWTTLDDQALNTIATELETRLKLDKPRDNASDETRAWYYNSAGLYFHNAENYLSALEGFRRAARLAPTDDAYVNNAASTYNQISQYRQGLAFMQHPALASRDVAMIKGWLGWFHYQLGQFEDAARHYRAGFKLGELSEDDLSAYISSLIELQALDRAERALDRHLPDTPGALAVRVQALVAMAQGDHPRALAVLDDAERRGVRDTRLDITRMEVLGEQRDYEAVITFSDSLIEQGRGSALVYNYRGDAQYQLERYRAAKQSLEKALALNPGDANIAEYLRFTNARLGTGDTATISTPIEPVAWPRAAVLGSSGLDAVAPNAAAEGYDSHYPLRVTAYHYDPDQPLKTTHVRHIRVHDRAGVKRHSTLTARFNPLNERLYINRLAVFDAEGNPVSSLDRSSVYLGDTEDFEQATFGKIARAPVAGLAPGHRVEFVYTLEQRSPAGEFPFERLYLSGDRPIGVSALYIEGELGDLLYNQHNAPAPITRDGSLLWTVHNPTPALWEPMQVDNADYMASVVLGSQDRWADAGEEYNAQIRELVFAEAPELAILVDELTGHLDTDDTRARIAALARYVQETLTYKALEFGVRGYIPNPPSKILQNRFGDCKDHSVLLWRLLREAGIPAELALANLSGPVDPDLPSVDQFDHMVVYLPQWQGGTFIDATDKSIDLLAVSPDGLGGSWSLTLGEAPRLVAVPEPSPSRIRVQRELTVLPDGQLEINERIRFNAYFASTLRNHLKNIEPHERLNWMQRFLGDGGKPVAVESLSIDHLFNTERDLVLKLHYQVSPMHFWQQRDLVMDPAYWEHYYLSSHWVHDRQTDFEVNYPLVFESEVSYRAPHREAIALGKQPARRRDSDFGRFSSHWATDAQRATRHFRFEIHAGRFDAGRYADYQQFTAAALDALRQPVTLSESIDPQRSRD